MIREEIIVGDCIEGMKQRQDQKFNLIIADPPYNLKKDFGVWKEDERRADWKAWSREWLEAAYNLLSSHIASLGLGSAEKSARSLDAAMV